jgi:acyl-CoA reductase-like NAD-dependent aldehyde dehydrogenase
VRRDLFLRAATLLEQRAEELAQYQMKETGATECVALHFDIPHAVETLREVAGKISSIYGAIPSGGLDDDSNSLVLKEPYGVILAIAPWYVYSPKSFSCGTGLTRS